MKIKKLLLPLIISPLFLLMGCQQLTNTPSISASQFETIQQRAEQNDPNAQYMLASIYQVDPQYKDQIKSFEWMKKAANNNVLFAKNDLGLLYLHGTGTKQDQKQGVYWLNQAAQGGDSTAMGNVGLYYYYGVGTPQNIPLAIHWFNQAIATFAYQKVGLYMLAKSYLLGTGVKPDSEKALSYLNTLAGTYYDTQNFDNKDLYKVVLVQYEVALITNKAPVYPAGTTPEMISQAKTTDSKIQDAVSITKTAGDD